MMNEPTPDRSGDSLPLLPLIILFGGVALLLLALFSANPTQREDPIQMTQQAEATAAVIAAQATLPPTEPPVVTVALDPEAVRRGSTIFSTVCSACHGFDARGIPGLGKTLIGSQFANSLSDADLVAFISQGRLPFDPLNTTGVAMPPRGGNPILTDADLYDVVAYIRSLNLDQPAVPTQPPGVPTTVPTAAPPTAVPPTLPPTNTATAAPPTEVGAAPTLPPTVAAPVISGPQADYLRSCAGCHGVDGKGVPTIPNSDITNSDLLSLTNGFALTNFLSQAQPPVDPRVAFPHPYRGGYPPLNDQALRGLLVYLYQLKDAANAPTPAPTAVPPTAVPPTPEPTLPPTTVAAVVPVVSGPEADYLHACAGCHGVDGKGVPTIPNSDITTSDLLSRTNGFALTNFLSQAQPPVDPRTAFPHPYRGGYPPLNDQALRGLLVYLYSLAGN